MIKIKLSLCMLSAIVVLCLSSCGLIGEQRYFCDVNNVKTVEIVRLDSFEGAFQYEETVLCEIENDDIFIERLNNLSHTDAWGPPYVFEEGYVYIRIKYINGDYDEIHHMVQSIVLNGEAHSGDFVFDKEQFEKLISDYLPK